MVRDVNVGRGLLGWVALLALVVAIISYRAWYGLAAVLALTLAVGGLEMRDRRKAGATPPDARDPEDRGS